MSSRKRCLDWLSSLNDHKTGPSDRDRDAKAAARPASTSISPRDSAIGADHHSRKKRKHSHRRRHTRRMDGDSEDELGWADDPDSTPRGAQIQQQRTCNINVQSPLRGRGNKSKKRARGKEEQDQDMRSDTTGSSKKSRGTSQSNRSEGARSQASTRRQMNWLKSMERPIHDETWTPEQIDSLPANVQNLVRRLNQCAELVHVVPVALQAELQRHDRFSPSWNTSQPWLSAEGGSNFSPTWTATPTFRELDTQVRIAKACQHRGDVEASWNSLSHGPILSLAQSLSPHCDRVEPVNITLARPMPRLSMVVDDVGTSETHDDSTLKGVGPKMVDFGIVLQESPTLRDSFRWVTSEEDGRSKYWNHTNSEQIATQPLAISIETKREGEGLASADLQLKVWAAMHLLRLEQLRQAPLPSEGPSTTTFDICLPLLAVFGPHWYWLIAKGEYNKADGKLARTVVFSKNLIGDVTTYSGVLKLLTSLLVLFEWSEVEWRSWFERWVTPTTAN